MTNNKNQAIKKIKIGLISSREIQEWGERILPNGNFVGEVLNSKTIHYRTNKPEVGGLFCQKIFGPIKDNLCACTKITKKDRLRQSQNKNIICDICGVERTSSKVRRYRFGHIKLRHSVIHSLFLSRTSSLAICLNWSNARINNIAFALEFCYLSQNLFIFSRWFSILNIIENKSNSLKTHKIIPEKFVKEKSLIKFKQKNYYTRLFHKSFFNSKYLKKILFQIKYCYQKLNQPSELFLYGINYDMTWDTFKKLEKFFEYIWKRPIGEENIIPYYFFKKQVKDYNISYRIRSYSTISNPFPMTTGGNLIEQILSIHNLKSIIKQLDFEINKITKLLKMLKDSLNHHIDKNDELFNEFQKNWVALKQLKNKYSQRLKIFRNFYANNIQPAWMTLNCLPVLPANLRPITIINGQPISSELNQLYRKIIDHNNRILNRYSFTIYDNAIQTSWELWCLNVRLLQESVNHLLLTGDTDYSFFQNKFLNQPKNSVSLLNSLKGKQGRFRQHILGKRVDYSGRSVIVIGPTLKIYECGLPFNMAVDLFLPYIIQNLRARGAIVKTTNAKAFISEHQTELWPILENLIKGHPILLNRAPTLHRLGIQAFLPKLILGKAIQLHPLVCAAYNADFDGDQMAVHIPLTLTAQAEAIHLIWSSNLILAPASGQPLLLPAQDMVLGCFYLTSSASLVKSNINSTRLHNIRKLQFFQKFQDFQNQYLGNVLFIFKKLHEVFQALENDQIKMHTPIWIQWRNGYQTLLPKNQAKISELPLEYQIDFFGNTTLIKQDRYEFKTISTYFYIRTTPGRLFFYKLILNF